MSTRPNFDIHSRFNPKKGFTAVKFGSNAKLLEVELNEMQEIMSHLQRQLTRSMYPDGMFHGGLVALTNGKLSISEAVIVLDGDVIEVKKMELNVGQADVGKRVYLRKRYSVIVHTDPIHEYGHVGQGVTLPNDLFDPRYIDETSRRIQLQTDLTTTNPTQANTAYIELGRISTALLEKQGTGTTPIFVSTIHTFIPLWMYQASFIIDGGDFTDKYTRVIDGGYFHENAARVLDGGGLT